AIFGTLIVMMGLIIFSATVMYELEGETQPHAFGSIPRAMWWSVTTLTTVGFGDAVPLTWLGKAMAGLVMIAGFGMFALPVAIISTGFADEIRRREFVVTWGMVARVPLFASLDAMTIGSLVQLLHAQVVEAGTVLGRVGEEAAAMYFIMLGQVQIEFPLSTVELGEGEFFGEVALLESRRRSSNIRALTRCTLLKLDSDDFARFTRRHPDVRDKILAVAKERQIDLKRRSNLEVEMAELEQEKALKQKHEGHADEGD
ncbi:MAG: cyclic nucleotide-binding domain-containing protein, partial [Rhizobiales bacterium]|nr:cyclic nucleotide-binding domain-containing protein [Hyphomicrobiales bacterium]